jgi:hypothetical protein
MLLALTNIKILVLTFTRLIAAHNIINRDGVVELPYSSATNIARLTSSTKMFTQITKNISGHLVVYLKNIATYTRI